jgi:hypothetical protein
MWNTSFINILNDSEFKKKDYKVSLKKGFKMQVGSLTGILFLKNNVNEKIA